MALNPIGLAPLAIVVGVLGLVVYSTVNERFNRNITRLSRRLFGRYVGQSADRERQLEAAYIGETYRSYAARTLLYAGAGAVAGSVGGAYAIGGFLLLLPDLVTLAQGLPSTMVAAFGLRDFELVLTPTETLYILIGGGVLSGAATAGLTYLYRWERPRNRADVRSRNIDEGLARTIAFMYALSRGGMSFPDVMRVLARNQEIYGDTAKEVSIAVREMDLFGQDMISALQHVSRRTPSEKFKTFSENLSSVLQSGQSLSSFLYEQYERHHEEAAERQSDLLERLATVAEAYVTVFVAAVLFLMTILLVFGLTTTDTLWLLQLLTYLVIPLANVGFMVYLDLKLQSLGIGSGGVTDLLDRYETASLGQPSAGTDRTEVTDGGMSRANDNLLRLQFYDRIKTVRDLLDAPIQSLIWNPVYVLYLTIPFALLTIAVRAPVAFRSATINVRVLDDIVIQAVLLVLGPFAVARYAYMRRLSNIEAATPDLLERLASLNEAGMTVVESLRRVRGGDLGVLTPEIHRIWADIEMGANVNDALVRFGRRVRTSPVTRIVTLLTNAMHASGQLGPVFRIAATQSRADLRLKRRRRQQMLTYLVVIYISFLVFLVIIVAVQEVLVPSLPSSVPTPASSSNRLGVNADQFARFGRVDKAAYTLVFFHTALIQAVLTGFIGGQLGEGTLKDGAKHAAILLGVAYVAFILLSSPVASMAVTSPAVSDDQITVESASLSEGGFIVVHQFEESGRAVGTSEYLPAGTHSDVQIALDSPPSSGQTLVLVAHQDTNGNEQFDYRFDSRSGQPDKPYASSTAGENVTTEYTTK
ncbi:MAG: type II secretion system F family protein [Haloarcula sp.]